MRKTLISSILLLFSAIALAFCPVPVTLTNEVIPCASGLSADPSRVHARLWIQGMADWTNDYTGVGQAPPGYCVSYGGCDSDGTDSVDEICMLEGTGSIIVPWDDCAGGNAGEYGLFTDWSTMPFDGCPSTDGLARAILLIYDDEGNYVLQSRSQGKDWDNWDEIGTTAATHLAGPSVDYGQVSGNLFLPEVPSNIIYGSCSAGDAPSAPLVTGRRLYFYFGCTPPSRSTSVWTAGETYPLSATYIENYDFPAAASGLWIAYALIVDGKELPFVSDYYAIPWQTGGSAIDDEPCNCTGLLIEPQEGCEDCIPFVDVLVDGTELVQGVNVWVYHGTCNVQHSFQFRGNLSFKTYSCWSAPVYATDIGIETPSTPVITSITDNDPNGNTGVTINFTPGTPALRQDLYRDNYLIQTGFTSGSTVTGLGCNISHIFKIAAVSNPAECHQIFSDPVSATDQCVGAPVELAHGETSGDAVLISTDKTSLSWPSYTGATGYRLYRGTRADLQNLPGGAVDNCCARYDGTVTSVDISGDTPASESFLWYFVTAYNTSGEGPAGDGRMINPSGTCMN